MSIDFLALFWIFKIINIQNWHYKITDSSKQYYTENHQNFTRLKSIQTWRDTYFLAQISGYAEAKQDPDLEETSRKICDETSPHTAMT